MHQTKLVQLLKLLEKREMTRFRAFAESPYFNKHQKVTALVQLIDRVYPHLDASPRLNEEKVAKKLFPKDKDAKRQLAYVMNYCMNLLEEFQAIEQFRNKETDLSLEQSRWLADKEATEFEEKALDKLNKKLNNSKLKDAAHYQQLHELEHSQDLIFLRKQKRTTDDHLQQKTNALDTYYLLKKLQLSADMLNRANIIGKEYKFQMLDELLSYIQTQPDLLQEAGIAIYYRIILTLKEAEQEDHFKQLTNLLAEHYALFGKEEARSMYDYAQNYCIKKINQGNSKYLGELLEIYKALLASELIYDEGILPQASYKNIVTVATRLKEYDWAEAFLAEHKAHVPEPMRQHVYDYNLASLRYSQGNYDAALKGLQFIEFTDLYYALGARSMLMKIYYETDEMDPLYSLFDAFRVYLRRNKQVSPYQRSAHLNLIKFTKKAYDLKLRAISARKDTMQKEKDKLLKQIDETGMLSNKAWLAQMVNGIK